MAVVQRYQQGNVDPNNIPNARISDSNVNSQSFGAGIGQALNGFAQMANEFAMKEQKKADDSALMDAETQLSDLENELFHSETGALNTRGKDAIGVGSVVLPEYDRRSSEIIASAPKRVQTQIQALAHGRKLDTQRSLMRHVSSESDRYYGAQAKGMIDLSVNNAGLNYQDAKRVDTEAQKAALAADKLSELSGFAPDDEVSINARREASSAVYESVISRKIQDDPFEAETYFMGVQDNLSAESQARIKSVLNPYVKSAEYDEMAQNIESGKTPKVTASDQESLIESVMQTEGGYNASDGNSGAPVNFGINQKYNPDINVKDLTADDAKAIYRERYWDAAGLDKVPAGVRGQMFDTAVNMGVGKAKELYKKSGGDPVKFAELRRQAYKNIVASDPSQAKHLEGWLARVDKYAGSGEFSPPKTLYEAKSIVRSTIQNPKDRKEVEARLALNFQIKEDDARQKKEMFSVDIYTRIKGSEGKVPLEKLFTPAEMKQAYEYGYDDDIKSIYKETVLNTLPQTDVALYEELKRQALDEPEKFVKNDFLKLAPRLSTSDRASFMKLKADMIDPKKTDAQKNYVAKERQLSIAYSDMGIGDDKVKKKAFDDAYVEEINAFVKTNKREPGTDERQEIINRMKLPFVREGWFSDSQVPGYSAKPGKDKVPADARGLIVDALKRAGISEPSEADILDVYFRGAGNQL